MRELPMSQTHCCTPAEVPVKLGNTTLGSTRAWCPDCRKVEHALYTAMPDGVFMERVCPKGGSRRSPVCLTREWFMERSARPRPLRQNKKTYAPAKGCPFDCGPCANHAGELRLPIFSLTNNCNLKCPICFTHNRPDRVYNKSFEELEAILDHIEAQSTRLDLLNLTGGEPTLHPQIFEILARCSKRSFKSVSMNSNGIILGQNRIFAERLKESGVQVILSLDTLDAQKSVRIHGRDIVREKLDALAALEDLNIPTALLLVWIPGENDAEVPELINKYLPRDFICGITIQNMAYTGHYGSRFSPRIHSTLEEVEKALGRHAGFSPEDFFAHGSYHPFCYSTAYYLTDGPRRISFTRLADRALLTEATEQSFLLHPTKELEERFRRSIDELWAGGASKEDLTLLKKFINRYSDELAAGRDIFGSGSFHGLIKTVTIHAHMDDDNFDLARVSLCGDLVPDEQGAMRPACSYNLLYRQQDPRFWAT